MDRHFDIPSSNLNEEIQIYKERIKTATSEQIQAEFKRRIGKSCFKNSYDLILLKLLIKAGANVNDHHTYMFSQETLLVMAIRDLTYDVELLLDAGADVNLAGEEGLTPLFMIIKNIGGDKHKRAIKLFNILLEKGANPEHRFRNLTLIEYMGNIQFKVWEQSMGIRTYFPFVTNNVEYYWKPLMLLLKQGVKVDRILNEEVKVLPELLQYIRKIHLGLTLLSDVLIPRISIRSKIRLNPDLIRYFLTNFL